MTYSEANLRSNGTNPASVRNNNTTAHPQCLEEALARDQPSCSSSQLVLRYLNNGHPAAVSMIHAYSTKDINGRRITMSTAPVLLKLSLVRSFRPIHL